MKITPEIKRSLEVILQAYPYEERMAGFISHPLLGFAVEPEFDDKHKIIGSVLVNRGNFTELVEKKTKYLLDHVKEVEQVFFVINQPYQLAVLYFIGNQLDTETYSGLLAMCWTSTEFPHQAGVARLVEMFKKADKHYLIEEDDYRVFSKLPLNVTVYRGVRTDKKHTIRGLSWSLDYSTARWFANRFGGDPEVYSAKINIKNVFAYFGGRNEAELVVNPRCLKEIREVTSPPKQEVEG